jgi:predicted RNA-binding Zn-ribbon protein involved in translation (DUF1610 family)/DNA polymerase elongation subunit (family B)
VRVLTLDIETRPSLAYVWSLWDEGIPLARLKEAGSVVCVAWKWLDKPKMHFASDFHDGHESMIAQIHAAIDEADAIIHYNGTSFDIKHLNREFVLAGLAPPSPHRNIDLLSVVRRRFKFTSSKLDHVAAQLGLGTKETHSGFDLWVRCMADDPKAWVKMKRYNCRDVGMTEALYYRLLPWIQHHPNVGQYDGTGHVCPSCGSAEVVRRGVARTTAATYHRYQCKACGAWSRGADRLPAAKALRPAA